jgi:hypothetical protein
MTTSNPTLPLPTIELREPRTLKSCNAATRSVEATEVAPDKEEKEKKKKKKGKRKKILHIYTCLQNKKKPV